MVASARLAPGLSGLRNRNARVTNKTILRVIRGNVDVDSMLLDDEEDEKNKVIASQGVDEEDANEHHLQQALSAYAQRTLSASQVRGNGPEATFIPTPDAAGRVSNYEDLYPGNRYEDPATHLRFSDSIDECCIGGLSGSFTYFLDERDAEWLSKYNSVVKGEGSSSMANGTLAVISSHKSKGRMTYSSRHVRGKGKDFDPSNVSQSPISIDEDEFELIMGLFEKWTDEQVSPYLHFSSDPQHFPQFGEYHKFLTSPIPPSTFTNFQPPPYTPSPEKMFQLAQTIYPWWKERRLERQGYRIVPQLHILVLEAQEKEDRTGSSPYTCFRKRDAKPMRRTRTNNVTHTEKLVRLRTELLSGLELAQKVVEREKLKRESAQINQTICKNRESLAEYMKVLSTSAPGSVPPADEQLLFDKERKPRKRAETTAHSRIILAPARRLPHVRPESLDPHSPLSMNVDTSQAFEECQKWPTAYAIGIQREVERDLARARKEDVFWEDITDLPLQPSLLSAADKFFKPFPINDATRSTQAVVSYPSFNAQPLSYRSGHSVRLRTGRGGRVHLDRVTPMGRRQRLLEREWATHPISKDERVIVEEDAERWKFRTWGPSRSHIRRARTQRGLIDSFMNRPSIYDPPSDNSPVSDLENETAGYGFGQQEVPGYEARGLWTKARASREEDGWKPTPHLAIDAETIGPEAAARNAAERDRIVEEWRGNTLKVSAGGALALFTDGNGDEQMGDEQQSDNGAPSESGSHTGRSDLESAWRVEQQWRYDSQNRSLPGHEADHRFILDDYQAKYLRTAVTLLDSRDHELLAIDSQLTAPIPSKPNRYQDHQFGLRLGLPLSPFASSIPHRQIPATTSSLSLPIPSNPPVGSQLRQVSNYTPTQPLPSVNGNASVESVSVGNPSIISSPKPVPIHVNGGARLPPDSGPVVRTNTPMRTKHSTNGVSLPTQLSVNGMGRNDYAILGKPVGVGNMLSKVFNQPTTQINGNGQEIANDKSAQTTMSHFAVPQLPSTGAT